MTAGLVKALAFGAWKLISSKAVRLAAARAIIEAVRKHEPAPVESKPIPPPQVFPVLVLALLGASVSGCALVRKIGGDDCLKLRVAEELACGAEASSVECRDARALLAERCGDQPPVAPPTTTPTPPVTPPEPRPLCPATLCPPGRPLCRETPAGPECYAEPTPEPPVPTSACPKVLAEGATVWVQGSPYGQGAQFTPYVDGDPEFCRLVHGVAANRCHLEGWPRRLDCELELLGPYAQKAQACPVVQYRNASTGMKPQPCTDQSFEGQHMSCDHFGDTVNRDDPKTPDVFEGEPKVCGEQRDQYGPVAGFFAVAHGKGEIRACRPDYDGCGRWLPIDK